MSAFNVRFSVPSANLFRIPPSPEPQALPPPVPGSTIYAPPILVSASLYNTLLDARVPITIATVYAITVSIINARNRSNGNKPWAISKTRAFFAFVLLHNTFLAVYSAWTFLGMFGALQRTMVGFLAPNGLANTVDSLCKLHGPRGLGDAVTFNTTLSRWVPQSSETLLARSSFPDSTDYGRFWNEGLAFYGWLFYLSKFYEVLDTFIILAKGKRSSTLQTYHHAGAMMCMWSGIRFMSPPIWMFVFVNSGIHALMYTYYTLTALSFYVPQSIKRSLTTLQIIQFLVGSSYAALHSFISYDIPVIVPVLVDTGTSTIVATTPDATPAGLADTVKTYLLRAAGAPGPANIGNLAQNQTVASSSFTTSETFAIWFNVLYLAPLTALFVRFFIRSYSRSYKRRMLAAKINAYANEAKVDHIDGNSNGVVTSRVNGSIY